jgi:hypothetical protein
MRITKVRTSFRAINCSNFTVACVLHESVKSFEKAFGPGGHDTWAFCTVGYARKRKRVATLNFCRNFVNVPLVAHEATHATLAVTRRLRLAATNGLGEELIAMITENIVRNVMMFLSVNKVKMKPHDALETAPSGLS